MASLHVFQNDLISELPLNIIIEDGKELFPATDSARMLGYANPQEAVRTHCKGVREVRTPTVGGGQLVKYITEGDLYRLIVRSNLPTADKFERWIFDEVIPSIRKHGAYMTPATLEQALTDPDFIIKLAMQLKAEQAKVKALEPKAEYFDKIVERNLLINLTVAAKELGVKRNALIGYMLDNKFLYRDSKENLIPYAMYCPELFEIKEWANDKASGVQTLLTPKGRETFRLLLKKDKMIGVK